MSDQFQVIRRKRVLKDEMLVFSPEIILQMCRNQVDISISETVSERTNLIMEMIEWCNANFQDIFRWSDCTLYCLNEEDLLHFCLRYK
jgi:hypothetical protein